MLSVLNLRRRLVCETRATQQGDVHHEASLSNLTAVHGFQFQQRIGGEGAPSRTNVSLFLPRTHEFTTQAARPYGLRMTLLFLEGHSP